MEITSTNVSNNVNNVDFNGFNYVQPLTTSGDTVSIGATSSPNISIVPTNSGAITPNDARRLLGLEPLPEPVALYERQDKPEDEPLELRPKRRIRFE